MNSLEESNNWISPDSERLWKLAHKIEDKQLWAGYLSEQEHSIWRKALRKRDTWTAFLKGHGEPLETGESQENGEIVNGGEGPPKTDDNGEKIADPVTTAFRARVMLFEFAVRKLYPSPSGDDLMDFDIDDILENTEEKVVEQIPKTRDIEEDDYDADEEDEAMPVVESSNQDPDSSMDNIGRITYCRANDR
jgi:hypothetical protein